MERQTIFSGGQREDVVSLSGITELSAIVIVTRAFADVIRSMQEFPDREQSADEYEQFSTDLAGKERDSLAARQKAAMFRMGGGDVLYEFGGRTADMLELAVDAFTQEPNLFDEYLTPDKKLEAQIHFPPRIV